MPKELALQARFLLHVLIYSGVFVERQYRAFTGIAHGQRAKDFLTNLVGRGYAARLRRSPSWAHS